MFYEYLKGYVHNIIINEVGIRCCELEVDREYFMLAIKERCLLFNNITYLPNESSQRTHSRCAQVTSNLHFNFFVSSAVFGVNLPNMVSGFCLIAL